MTDNDAAPSRETLDAYADGELPAAEMTRLAAVLARRPDLQAYVDRQQALRDGLGAAFAPLMAEPVPDRLLHAVRATPIARRSHLFSWRAGDLLSWRLALPAGAALALGLVLGLGIDRPGALPFVGTAPSGQVLAQGELAHALNEQLASDGGEQAARVGVSFRNKSGQDCRTFAWSAGSSSTSGVACRASDGWVVAALATSARQPNARAAYQMAGADMPATIRDTVNDMIAGEPFDAPAERAARARHWQ